MTTEQHYHVVILGAGLAGLSLSRHLLRESDKRILVLDKSAEVPTSRQKYGESSVQVGGYYFAKILDLEEYLWHEQFMKYNLRFYFKTPGRENDRFEDYSQSYIRTFSNIPCYQLDRNRFEADLLAMNRTDARFTLVAPAADIRVELADNESTRTDVHVVSYRDGDQLVTVNADWVVDTTGRGRMLARQMDIREPTPINHDSSFMWVEGTVDIEKLTDSTPREIRLNKNRRATGHVPHWLATNHFMGEGFWFWVIPLRGMTSLGLVYDNRVLDRRQFASAESLRDWVCREFPLFARDLPQRRIVDFSALRNFSHGCSRTISPSRWAMSGEAGRFTDPLYSPGSDFIGLHNTLIVDAILTEDAGQLRRKCWLSEMLMQSYYQALIPTFATSYNALGDQEAFVLKYTWELSVYFVFFVFPFINELVGKQEFTPAYLSRFARLGEINHNLQTFISGFFQWKKSTGRVQTGQVFHDFMALMPLQNAEKSFYQVGLSATEAVIVLDSQLDNLRELARFIVAYIYSVVLDDDRILMNLEFIQSIDFKTLTFDPPQMLDRWEPFRETTRQQQWLLDPNAMRAFRKSSRERDATPAEGTL